MEHQLVMYCAKWNGAEYVNGGKYYFTYDNLDKWFDRYVDYADDAVFDYEEDCGYIYRTIYKVFNGDIDGAFYAAVHDFRYDDYYMINELN